MHLLFVCDFWHQGNFRNTDEEEKYNVGWAQCFMSSADGRDNANNKTQNALALEDGADKKLNDSSMFASVFDEISAHD